MFITFRTAKPFRRVALESLPDGKLADNNE